MRSITFWPHDRYHVSFTFLIRNNRLTGPSSAVYYNPAKTIGGMIEADTFCFIGWLYSAFVCLSGMSLFWWLDVQPGWDGVADCIPILWVGFSMWGLSWMKVWMEKPTFNSGLSHTRPLQV